MNWILSQIGCRAANSSNFSRRSQNLIYFSKWGSKELYHAATDEDLKNNRRGVKKGSWLPDIQPFQVSNPWGALHVLKDHPLLSYFLFVCYKFLVSHVWCQQHYGSHVVTVIHIYELCPNVEVYSDFIWIGLLLRIGMTVIYDIPISKKQDKTSHTYS